MKISSISSEIGAAIHPATSTKRDSTIAGEPVTSADQGTSRIRPVVDAISPQEGVAEGAPIVDGLGQGLKILIDEETGEQVIRVIDIESGRTIRQIPPGEVLNFLRQYESRKGLWLSVKS